MLSMQFNSNNNSYDLLSALSKLGTSHTLSHLILIIAVDSAGPAASPRQVCGCIVCLGHLFQGLADSLLSLSRGTRGGLSDLSRTSLWSHVTPTYTKSS